MKKNISKLLRIYKDDWQSQEIIRTKQRNLIIDKNFLNKKFQIYNGIQYFDIVIQQNMLGHKLGEFALTRRSSIKTKKRKSINIKKKNKK